MTGTLIGVGVGPGDPELMTLKAARVIERASVIAYPVANGERSRARDIACGHIPAGAMELPFSLPMKTNRTPAQTVYDEVAENLRGLLGNGRDVALLCEGDPLFYGSFMYIAARLADGFPIKVIPGITSVGAAAAQLARPLTARRETFCVVPATAPIAEIKNAAQAHDCIVILKAGPHLSELRRMITDLGLLSQSTYVANATLEQEVAVALSEAPDKGPYFSLVLITKSEDPWLS